MRNAYLFYKAQFKCFQLPEAFLTTVESEVSSFFFFFKSLQRRTLKVPWEGCNPISQCKALGAEVALR